MTERFRRVWVQALDRPLTTHEIRQLRAVWDAVPHVRCKGLCVGACKQVPLFPVEAFYLIEKHAAEIAPGQHPGIMTGRSPVTPTLGVDKPCQYLKDGRCSIYEDRPLICRLYGHPAGSLPCNYGCVVKKPLDYFAVGRLMMRVARILNPAVPKELTSKDEFRAGFDALYRQWDDMTLLAEVLEEGDDPGPEAR